MNEENIKKDALEIARLMRSYAEDCDSDFCSSCCFCFFCEDEYTPDKIANVIEELVKQYETAKSEGVK